MARALDRLLRPKTIAVVGGGAWCRHVIEQCQKMGFAGDIWPVHPAQRDIAGLEAVAHVDDLPAAPDACFIGVNRHATVEVVSSLAGMGAGGAVCFASGFLEASREDEAGADLQRGLLEAAGEMPILGPNCYGFINYLDGALLWPDQHGGGRVACGVAIVTQSSNIAINLTMQARGLPLAYIVTAGNQAQTGIAEIGAAVLDDARVSVLGLHIEGFGDLRAFEALARKARVLGKKVVALKVGKSAEARAATMSHTASLAGSDAGAEALLARLGIARVGDIPTFLETLKLLHVTGGLASNTIATLSCSGGEASLAADIASEFDVVFPPLNERQTTGLRAALGPMVSLANPLDYHTYIWRDVAAMTRCFAAVMDPDIAMTMIIADFPRADRCDPGDWDCVIDAVIAAKERTGGNVGLIATMPELMPETVAARMLDAGVVPFCGLREAIAACAAGHSHVVGDVPPLLLPTPDVVPDLVVEADAKARLHAFGLDVPVSRRCESAGEVAVAARDIGFPVVLKGEGVAHKTEAGAVAVGLGTADEVTRAAKAMEVQGFLVEQMIEGAVAELLVGVVKDPAHGFVMTLAAGGIWTEILQDRASFLLPATPDMIEAALDRLKISAMLKGYRGARAADRGSIIAAVRSVEAYVLAHADGLQEIEINPLLCTPERAVAVDALIYRKDGQDA